MKQFPINLMLLIFFLFLQILQLFLLPTLLLPQSPAWGYLLVIPVLLSNSWWAFIHEAIHGCMFAEKRINRAAGRVNAILFGSPFDLLRWGHLLHHAYSRTERERSEVFTPGNTSLAWFKFSYYFRLSGGLYLFEVLGGLLLLLPMRLIRSVIGQIESAGNVVAPLYQKVLEKRTLASARIDALLILIVYSIAFYLYAGNAWMLACAILARACLISLVDNLFHYETPLEHTRYARNLHLPAWAARLILNFNLHGVHHLHPHSPWWQLPSLHAEAGDGYQSSWITAMQNQFKGPIPIQQLAVPMSSSQK